MSVSSFGLSQALERKGVYLMIATADAQVSFFYPLPLNDDAFQDAEQIAIYASVDVMKFFVEQGFYMSQDNKGFLGFVG